MTMREKMARAMCKAEGLNPDADWRVHGNVMASVACDDDSRFNWNMPMRLRSVDAALDALMEPTNEMIGAGVEAMGRNNLWDGWPAMIRAAKEESK